MEKIEIDLEGIRKNGIFLMTPCYGGMTSSGFANSVSDLALICGSYKIPFQKCFINNESLVTRARNYCVDYFLNTVVESGEENEPPFKFGSAIFIDSDIEFNAFDIIQLAHYQIQNNYGVLTGNYPRKRISWSKIVEAVKSGVADENPSILENFVGDFIFRTEGTDHVKLNEPTKVVDAPTGYMMIQRWVFEKLDEKFPQLKYYPDHVTSDDFNGDRMISCYFDTHIDQRKRYLSEDYYFCALCREAGIDVLTLPWVSGIHYGTFPFSGNIGMMASLGLTGGTPETEKK